MKIFKNIYIAVVFLGVLSVLAAFFGTALSYQKMATPASAWSLFSGINARDGWISDGAEILPENLAKRGNRMTLHLKGWRPAGQAPAHLIISLCDEIMSEFIIDKPMQHTLPLRGDCEPRKVSFEVINPFVPSASDTRALGTQLSKMEISSKVGLPLINPWLVVQVAFAIFICSLLYLAVFWRTSVYYLPYLVGPIAFLLLKNALYLRLDKVYPVWLAACACALGLFIGKATKDYLVDKLQTMSDIKFGSLNGHTLLAFLAVIVGAAFRFYDIDFGLPSNFHPDEVPKVNAVMRMVDQNTLNPQYFLHPSLLLYSTYFMNLLFHFFGLEGEFRDTAFLAGRTVSAIGGTLSIYFVYIIGKRLFSAAVGAWAALLLSVFPLHIACSHYLKEDALLLTLVLAALVAVLKAVQDDKMFYLFLGGLLAGCSASTKYSGLLTAVIVAAAPWLRSKSIVPDKRFFVCTALALLLVPIGFVLCSPYSVLDSARFLKDFNAEKQHMIHGHTLEITAWSQYWMYHFMRSIIPGTSFLATLVAVMGVGLCLWRRKIEDLLLLGLLLLFYLPAEYVKAKPAPQPERYILPCLPFVALLATEFLRVLWYSRYRIAAPILFILILAFPAYKSYLVAGEIGNDTRDQMAKWMIANLPAGSKVTFDWKPYEPRFFNNEFEVNYLHRARIVTNLSTKSLKESGQDYLLLSSLWYGRYFTQPRSDARVQSRIRKVFKEVPIIKEFRPKYKTYGFHNPSVTLFSLKEEDFLKLEKELEQKLQGKLEQTSNEKLSGFAWW